MTQRLGLARVLLHDPAVLLLDEPASGLDPRARIEMRELLKRLGGRGKTIMVSSHILPELADICNKVGIIERGDMLVNAEVSEIMKKVRDRPVLIVELLDPAGSPRGRSADDALRFLSDQPEVESADRRKDQIVVTVKKGVTLDAYAELLPRLIAEGFRIRSFHEEEINLETAFMTLTKGMTA